MNTISAQSLVYGKEHSCAGKTTQVFWWEDATVFHPGEEPVTHSPGSEFNNELLIHHR